MNFLLLVGIVEVTFYNFELIEIEASNIEEISKFALSLSEMTGGQIFVRKPNSKLTKSSLMVFYSTIVIVSNCYE